MPSRLSLRAGPSPGLAASRGTRTVTVWSEPSRDHRPGVFHLSVAENGEELYGCTAHGTTAEHRGVVPEPLRLPAGGPDAHRRHEHRALEALAAETASAYRASHSPRAACTPSAPAPGTAPPARASHT
ncbi:hypothetical protein [Streptomyces shenzhenensis]|uniref:hypothetical protein n=1 Tax=Streptomyces shenzhenensis TaxID=943815 RepID=UPI001F2146ED|nr:hypothetical protein [Streptomyces shenzhenensis]